MKNLKLMLSAFVLIAAIGAAFATTENSFTTEVWMKPDVGGNCDPTACRLQGNDNCGETGFQYYNNASCLGTTIIPKKD